MLSDKEFDNMLINFSMSSQMTGQPSGKENPDGKDDHHLARGSKRSAEQASMDPPVLLLALADDEELKDPYLYSEIGKRFKMVCYASFTCFLSVYYLCELF